MGRKIILLLLVFLLLISACTQPAAAPIQTPQMPAEIHIVSETKKTKVIEETEGLGEITGEIIKETKVKKVISIEVKKLLDITGKEVQSLRYKYKGPETNDFFYDFFVKGNKIKYILSPTHFIDVMEDEYDAIYIDKELKTAFAYCDNQKCYRKGKKAVLDYDEVYISTPLDWHNNIESAEKLGEEVLGKRATWKIAANSFTVWLDTFFGVPLQVEFAGNMYEFQKMTFNQLTDGDVSPKS
jgi:hypothetical protein